LSGFENPGAFFLLLFVPLLFVLRHIKILSPLSVPLTLCDWRGKKFSYPDGARKFLSAVEKIFSAIFFVCLVTALANPVRHVQYKIFSSKGAAIIFVVDVSPSMAAKDIGGLHRLDAAKKAIRALAENDGGSEFGLVEMAENAAVLVPPTMDRKIFFDRLENLRVGELGDGTAIGTGISCAVYHLEKSSSQKKSIVLITDGENNSGEVHPFTAAHLAAEKNISLYVLGIGTNGSVPLDYVDPKTNKVYSGFLESVFDSQAAAKLASEGGGTFFEVDSIPALSQAISSVSKNEGVVQSYRIKNRDVFYRDKFLLAAAAAFFVSWLVKRIFLQEVL
jgi:Ca-activated chloride channel family protein